MFCDWMWKFVFVQAKAYARIGKYMAANILAVVMTRRVMLFV